MLASTSFRDIHQYDGKLSSLKTKIQKGKIPVIEKKEMFNKLLPLLKTDAAKRGVQMIINDIQQYPNYDNKDDQYADDILSELTTFLFSDKDEKGFDSIDILMESSTALFTLIDTPTLINTPGPIAVLDKDIKESSQSVKEKDSKEITETLIRNISEQMDDMATLGTCPQGRSTRLFSIYSAFYDVINPI